ncbi:endolytic transglycosylase MltG [Patescibacteria group bacterium]
MKKLFSLLIFIFVAALALGFAWWKLTIKPIDPQNEQLQVFVIPQGQAATTIGKRLKTAGFIRSNITFQLMVNRQGYSNSLQAGDFYLAKSMNLETIIESLTHGSLDYWVTFPEGLRSEEYVLKLQEKIDIDPQEFILAAKPYEGMLFPDTYLIPQTASAQDIVDILVKTFKEKSPTQNPKNIIIASLIEREAKHQQDRPLVSSVIHNRLDIGMALQLDATVQYVLGKPGKWWPNNLTANNLKVSSPYNTYQNVGLPPKPIANPGLNALKAAINPDNTDYLYYVSDSSGYNHYAKDLEGHEQNIEKYLK